jgi:ssDNA-binding Zn-finger/Zn-ribbon topoisomerase 1
MYDISTRGYHKMAGSSGAPKLLFCLHVDFKDGQHKDFVSDATWKARESGIRHTSIYSGEWRDATLSAKSHRAVITSPYWDVPLVKQQAGTLVKIHQELPTTEIAPGIYDTRQNCSGIIRIKVKGKRGEMLVCPDRECGYRPSITQITNARCPNCHKKMELRGEGEKQMFVCICGYREKLTDFRERRASAGANKREVQKYLANQDQPAGSSAMADAMARWLEANKKDR